MTTTNCLKPSVREVIQPGVALSLGGIAIAAFFHTYKIYQTDATTLAKATGFMASSGLATNTIAMCAYRKWGQKATIEEEDTWSRRSMRAALSMASTFVGTSLVAIPQLANAIGVINMPIQYSLGMAAFTALTPAVPELLMPSTKFNLNTQKLDNTNTSLKDLKQPIEDTLTELKNIITHSNKAESDDKIKKAKDLAKSTEGEIKKAEVVSKEVDKCSVKDSEQSKVKTFQDNLKEAKEDLKKLQDRLTEIDNIKS